MFSIKNMLQGQLSGVGTPQFKRVQSPAQTRGFTRTLNKATLWATTGSDITLSAASWVRIGNYTVPAQQRIHIGYGVSGGNPEEIGHIHFDLVDDTATNSAQEAGEVRFGYTNANETLTCVIFQERTELLSDPSTTTVLTRATELLLPETPPSSLGYPDVLAQEDSILFVDMKADAADVLVETGIGTGAINVWRLPVTIYQ